MRTQSYLGQIIDPQVFSEPSVIADLEIPRKFYAETGFDIYAFADLGTKEAQEKAAERRRNDPLRAQQRKPAKVPRGLNQPWRAANQLRVIGDAEIDLRNRRAAYVRHV
jgi:hypothetical protein